MQQLLSLLSDSLSADPARRIPSQHSLTSLTFNQAQDLLPPLLDIVADESIPVEIRTASIVFFKNFLDLNIRKIPKSVRADVRSRLLIFPTLESSLPISISKLLAISIGKLVRMDYGDNWSVQQLVTDARQNYLLMLNS